MTQVETKNERDEKKSKNFSSGELKNAKLLLRVFFVSFFVMAMIFTDASLYAAEIILGINKITKHQIVIPDKLPENKALAESIEDAARLIQNAFAANGIDIKIVKESQKDSEKSGIYLGNTVFAKEHGVDVSGEKNAFFLHKAVGKNIIIMGKDSVEPLSPRGDKIEPGTYFSAFEFLYRHAGVRVIGLKRKDIVFIPQALIHVPDNLNVRQETFFRETLCWGYIPSSFRVANHFDSWRRTRVGSHRASQVIAFDKFGDSHPEYFIEQGKVRQPKISRVYPQICYSNPEVRELLYQDIVTAFRAEGYDIVIDGQPDGYTPCQCSKCKNIYGVEVKTSPIDGYAFVTDPGWGEKLWIYHRKMAERLLKDCPGKKLMIMAYGPTTRPPQTFDTFPSNVIIFLADSTAENFARWKRIKGIYSFAAYLYFWNPGSHGLTPHCSNRFIGDFFKRARKYNLRMVSIDTPPTSSGMPAIETPTVYAFCRMGVDPEYRTADQLLDEYTEAAFGKAAPQMNRFFRVLQARVDSRLKLYSYADSSSDKNMDPVSIIGAFYPVDFIIKLDNILASAEDAPTLPDEKRRIADVRQDFDYLKHTAIVLHEYRNLILRNNQESFDRVVSAVEARNAYIKSIAGQRYDYFLKGRNTLDTSPFNWDTEKMKKLGLAGLRDREIVAKRTKSAPTLESEAWDSVPATSFNVPQKYARGPELTVKTNFKLLYDDNNIYIRISGEQPAGMMNFNSLGHDHELWKQECIVINLAPEFVKHKYFYFTYDPVPDSHVEAEHGFITDNAHPRYGWNDDSWDGKWGYENKLDTRNGRWESMAVIPFKTLRTITPKEGAEWYANFGRVHKIKDPKSEKLISELSVWNGELNMSHVPGDASMGKVIFK